MFDNTLTIVISHYCIFTEALPRLIPHDFRLLSSLPLLRFSSHRGEFAAITFGKDEVLPRANGPIVSSSTVLLLSLKRRNTNICRGKDSGFQYLNYYANVLPNAILTSNYSFD